ncbi:MAG: nitrilase-related carbon-nitrogen hydrolase, partial [Gemmatimonadales bacterium]
LLRRTEREASAGAELVSWSETAGRVLKPDEPDLLARAGRHARERRVYLAVAYGTFSPGAARPLENRVALIDTAGTVAFITDKVHPIVGPESPMVAPGDRRLRFLDTPFGRLGVVVCHDLDFPELLRQAGAARAALVIGPSDDWTAIISMHANMALVRAVEQGFTLFRPTAGGRSLAVTPRGRTLAAVDAPRDAFVAILRPAARRTLYAATGDLFAWGCVVGMVGAALLTVVGRVRRET